MKKLAKCMFFALTGLVSAAMAQQAEPAKVAQVKKGELKEARASWWGFDAADSTKALSEAIASKVPRLIVDKMPGPWIVGSTLKLVSNQEIVFEEGTMVLAKKGAFLGSSEVMFRLANIENVTMRALGKGATIKMLKWDYHKPPYKLAEWRHTISILSSKNISLLNLNLVESGGDGIYFGISTQGVPPTNITVKNCICDGHNRQGISVIAGVNCLIENTKLINTEGTAPEAGIDFEPNRNNEPIQNFVMRNCYSYNNKGGGYVFYLPNMDSSTKTISVTLDKCTSFKDRRYGINYMTQNGPIKTLKGEVNFTNCLIDGSAHAFRISGSSAVGARFNIENLLIRNTAAANLKEAAIEIAHHNQDEEAAGNLHFRNVIVEDDTTRPTFHYTDGGFCGGLRNIDGVIVRKANGKTSSMTLTNEWAEKNFPMKHFRAFPMYDMTGMQFVPLTPKAKAPQHPLPNLQQRGTGTWLFYASKGMTIQFSAKFGQLGKYKGDFAEVTCKTPSGKELKVGKIPFLQTQQFKIANVTETGFYAVTIKPGSNWSCIKSSNVPVVVNAQKPTGLVSGCGEFFAYVPAGTKEFCMRFIGEGQEGLKVTIFGPDGKQVWFKDDIASLEQFIGDGALAQKGGIFKIRVEPPTNLATIEDYHIAFFGFPPFLGVAPELLMAPVNQ